MTEAFTPGPWRIHNHTATGVVAENDRFICSTGGYQDSRLDSALLLAENEANARLISAAPDLLQALENLVAWKDATEIIAPELGGLLRAFYHAEAAIMKARGKS